MFFRLEDTHNLNTLHTILSTGAPLKPASYDYVYRDIKKDVMLGSISGNEHLSFMFSHLVGYDQKVLARKDRGVAAVSN